VAALALPERIIWFREHGDGLLPGLQELVQGQTAVLPGIVALYYPIVRRRPRDKSVIRRQDAAETHLVHLAFHVTQMAAQLG